jgi:hypothetical protein
MRFPARAAVLFLIASVVVTTQASGGSCCPPYAGFHRVGVASVNDPSMIGPCCAPSCQSLERETPNAVVKSGSWDSRVVQGGLPSAPDSPRVSVRSTCTLLSVRAHNPPFGVSLIVLHAQFRI